MAQHYRILALALAAGIAGSSAQATVQTQVVSGGGLTFAALPGFDSTLGTLQSLGIQASYSSAVGFVSFGPAPADHAVSGVFTLGSLVFSLQGMTTTTMSSGPFGTFGINASGSTTISGSDLTSLMAAPRTLSVSHSATAPGMILSSASPTLNYTLSYTYDDGRAPPVAAVGSVPEPASWALLITGFAAIGFAMRRARRTSAIAEIG